MSQIDNFLSHSDNFCIFPPEIIPGEPTDLVGQYVDGIDTPYDRQGKPT